MNNEVAVLKLSRQLVRKNFDFLHVLRYTQNSVHRERERTFVTILIEARRELGARSLVNYLYRAIQHSDFELLRDFKFVTSAPIAFSAQERSLKINDDCKEEPFFLLRRRGEEMPEM